MINKLPVILVFMSSALVCMESPIDTAYRNQVNQTADPSTAYSYLQTFVNRIQTRLALNRQQNHDLLANGQMRQTETNEKRLTPYVSLSMDQIVNLDEADEVIGYGAYVMRRERTNCDPIICLTCLSLIGSALICILASN